MEATNLIVVGTPFSGAALLGHALHTHSQAFFAGEPGRQWDPAARPATPECRGCAGESATWNDPVVAAAVAAGPAAVSAAPAATTGRRLVVEGTASANWLAERLACGASCAEDTRVVVCVCDPLLHLRRRAGVTEEYAQRRGAEWRDRQNALMSATLASGRPLLVVRHEDLTERTEGTLARVCTFAGVGYEAGLAECWEAPAHAIDAKSEDRGAAEPVRANQGPAGPGEPRDEDEREQTAAWVREDLCRIREAVVEGRAEEAIGTLRLLVDRFGPAFDELGLELDYERLAGLLVDLLNHQQRGAEALPYAQALVEHAPQSLEARRLLAVAVASTGDVPATLEAYGQLVQMSRISGTMPASLPGEVADLFVTVDPYEPAMPAFLGALAAHTQLAAVVEATLAARFPTPAPPAPPTPPALQLDDVGLELFYKCFMVSGLEGWYLEFGCFEGCTFHRAYSAVRKIVEEFLGSKWDSGIGTDQDRDGCRKAVQDAWDKIRFVAFDSFEGIPGSESSIDTYYNVFRKGSYKCTQEKFEQNMRAGGIDVSKAIVVPGFFEDTLDQATAERIGLKEIAVAHIDSDLYSSARCALEFCTPYFRDGSIVIFDEYFQFRGNPFLGERRAFTDWQAAHPEWVVTDYTSSGPWTRAFILSKHPGV